MNAESLGVEADTALQKGELERALKLYSQVSQLEPHSPRWPGAMAFVLRKLGRRAEEIDALAKVARIYVDGKDTLRAISTLKHILTLAPDHQPARRALTALSQSVAKQPAPTHNAVPRAATEVGPLDKLALHKVVQGSIPIDGKTRMHRIPLRGEDASMELSITGAPRKKSKKEDFALEEALVADVAAEVRTADRAHKLIPKVDLFAALDPASLDQMIVSAKLLTLAAGAEIFHQGDPSDALYVVSEGEVAVVDEGPPRRGIAKLEAGEIFGEIGIFTERTRTATTLALRPTELLAIDRAVVRRLVGQNPNVVTAMLGFMRDRMIGRLVATHPLFSVLSPADTERLTQRLQFFELEAGATLIETGRAASALFIVFAGRFALSTGAILESGDVAGEISIFGGVPEPATVRAETRVWVIAMGADDCQKILAARPDARAYVSGEIAARAQLTKKRWGA